MATDQPAARTLKYRGLRWMLWGGNKVLVAALRRGVVPSALALLETVGRRSGLPRQTPVGNGSAGDTFWLVAAHGLQADFVRNITAQPRVRVKINGVWRGGTAGLMPEDDVDARSRALPYQWDAAIGRAIATTPLTIRIDLDHDGRCGDVH